MSETRYPYVYRVYSDGHVEPAVVHSDIEVDSHENQAAASGLKPCPFCGATDGVYDIGAIECSCGARGPQNEKQYVARAEWNRRAAASGRDAAIRALFVEVIGRVLSDHDDFEGIASGRLPASVNQGRDTWRVANDYAARLGVLLGKR
jgi:hypothetical protein